MTDRVTWVAALLAAGLLLAACQEETETADGAGSDSSATTQEATGEDEMAAEAGSSTAETTESATSDTGAASNEATDAAVDAAQSGESPSQAAEDDARSAAEESGVTGAEAGEDGTLDELLTRESFDSARVIAGIRSSDLDQQRKDALVERVQSLEGSEHPALRDEVIAEIREALVSG